MFEITFMAFDTNPEITYRWSIMGVGRRQHARNENVFLFTSECGIFFCFCQNCEILFISDIMSFAIKKERRFRYTALAHFF